MQTPFLPPYHIFLCDLINSTLRIYAATKSDIAEVSLIGIPNYLILALFTIRNMATDKIILSVMARVRFMIKNGESVKLTGAIGNLTSEAR